MPQDASSRNGGRIKRVLRPRPTTTRSAGLAFLICGAATRAAASQELASADTMPALADLPVAIVADSTCAITPFVTARDPSARQTRSMLKALLGPSAVSSAADATYYWIVWLPVAAGSSSADTLATLTYGVSKEGFTSGDKLYEADQLRIVVLLPSRPDPASPPWSYGVRAGTAVRHEESLLGRGFPGFLGALLEGLARGRQERGPRCPDYAAAVHATTLDVADATIFAQLEIEARPALSDVRAGQVLQALRRRRLRIQAALLGYPQLRSVLDAIQAAAEADSSAGENVETWLRHSDSAAVAAVDTMELTAQHRIEAIREGAQLALAFLEDALAESRLGASRRLRVIDRPVIGFSVGGILAEESGEKLQFEVEDGRVMADGVQGEGFKTLALVDLYFRRVDLSESSPGFLPHASLGFTIGEAFRPGVFVGTTLPFTAGRLAIFGGGIVRRETTSRVPAGTEVEPGTEPLDERLRFPLVAGLKVGLPF